MSLPKIKNPSYLETQLNELKKEYMKSNKPIEKSSSPRKSESPISSKNVKSLSKLQTIIENE